MTDTSSLRAFIEARLDEDEASRWPHRLDCQMVTRNPGWSCNCDSADRWHREIEAKRALLAMDVSPDEHNNDCVSGYLDAVYDVQLLLAAVWSRPSRLPHRVEHGMSDTIQTITAEMVAMTDEVEAVKRLAGHGGCNGWGIGGDPYGARCGCGMPFDELAALVRFRLPSTTAVTYEIVDGA